MLSPDLQRIQHIRDYCVEIEKNDPALKANVDRILGIEKDAEIEKDEPTSTRS